MIPKILWRIWLDDPMPALFAKFGDRWQELHPGWGFRELRDSADLAPMINHDLFDRAKQIIPGDWKRFQADLLRLELLYQDGGVYVDTDVEPLKPLDDLLDRDVMVAWSPNRGPKGERLLTQAVIGAIPGHPFIKACIDSIPTAVQRHGKQPLAQMVGPWHLTRIFREWPYGVQPLPERTFYPRSTLGRGGSYTVHHWNSGLRRRGKGLG